MTYMDFPTRSSIKLFPRLDQFDFVQSQSTSDYLRPPVIGHFRITLL